MNYVGEENAAHWARVKYSMSWPSSSDPFYLANSADQDARRNYYGVNGIPAGFGNGSSAGSSASTWRSFGISDIGDPTPVTIIITTVSTSPVTTSRICTTIGTSSCVSACSLTTALLKIKSCIYIPYICEYKCHQTQ